MSQSDQAYQQEWHQSDVYRGSTAYTTFMNRREEQRVRRTLQFKIVTPQIRKLKYQTIVVATALALCACSSERPNGSSPDSMRNRFVEQGLLVPGSRREISAKFGTADSIRTRPQQNRHNASQTDSIVDIYYPGLQLTFYVVSEGGNALLQTVMVSDNRYLRYPELGIGASSATRIAALGEPNNHSLGKYRYDCKGCPLEESPVYFHLTGDTVRRIGYSFYVD